MVGKKRFLELDQKRKWIEKKFIDYVD